MFKQLYSKLTKTDESKKIEKITDEQQEFIKYAYKFNIDEYEVADVLNELPKWRVTYEMNKIKNGVNV